MAAQASEAPDPPALDRIAGELYGLAPRDFVSTRTAAEKQAKSSGDRELASAIRALAKPTTVAWLANQLVREHGAEIGPLLELGAGLRAATASLRGEELRQLSQQQYQVINALIAKARPIAKAAGQQLTEATVRGLEETLRAALAEPELAAQLASGRLTNALEHTGFSELGGEGGVAQPAAGPAAKPGSAADAKPTAAQREAAERARAEHERQQAQDELTEATARAASAKSTVNEATHAVAELAGRIRALTEELDRAHREHQHAERVERESREALERAERAAGRAQHALEAAQQAYDRLT